MMAPYIVPVQYITPILKQKILSVIASSFDKTVNLDDYDNVVISQHNGQIAGIVCLRHDLKTNWVMLENLCVTPPLRCRGIATELIDYCLLEFKPTETHALHVNSGSNHKTLTQFYLKRGFHLAYTNRAESLLLSQRDSNSM